MATSAKKSSATTSSAAKKSSTPRRSSSAEESTRRAPKAQARPTPTAGKVAALALRELSELTGKDAEGVTGLERTDEGWTVNVEVVELRRVPETTDVLALYEVTTDSHGDMKGYRRLRRYVRGVPGDE